jgi:hypothetical protein
MMTILEDSTRSNQMASRYMPLFCLAGLLVLPTSLALACHLDMASVEIGCTQYRFKVTAVGVPSTYSIRYTFNLASNTAEAPLTISNTIPITDQSDDFTETNPLKLAGNYNAQSLSGDVSLITSTGETESTIPMTFSPIALNCSSPAS